MRCKTIFYVQFYIVLYTPPKNIAKSYEDIISCRGYKKDRAISIPGSTSGCSSTSNSCWALGTCMKEPADLVNHPIHEDTSIVQHLVPHSE